VGRTRRNLRRAREWRWEPPGADDVAADQEARHRWHEARAKSIAWAADVAADPRTVFLDTETTGFGPRAEIVDIAVVSGSGELLLESLVRPERRIPYDASAIHGITDADVRGAPRWNELYDDVLRVMSGRRIVVYNVVFDRQMVCQACDAYALDAPTADWDCAMKKYAGFHGNWDSRKRWYSFVKLEKAVLSFGAEPGGHRAAADAFACRAVVLGMAATPPPIVEIQNQPAVAPAAIPRPWQTPPRDEALLTAVGTLSRWAHAAREFRELLEMIPVELRERPGACGVWSVREVAAHAAGWEWEAARRLRLIAATPDLPDARYTADAFNGANVAVRASQSWKATADELAKASHTFGMAAAALPDDRRTREWLLGRTIDFEEHTDGLRRWLDEVAAGV
jgi:DNA polymerase-3 subunit epsilon